MSDEKKYLIFCWGSILLTGVLLWTLYRGSSGAITAVLVVLILVCCTSACYIGNRPDEVPPRI